jgi:hypothetical protein
MRRAADNPPLRASITVPDPLPDEAAAALIELLHELTEALESQYAGQLLRHYRRPDHRQCELWDDADPPF